jgi:hypothetical protein
MLSRVTAHTRLIYPHARVHLRSLNQFVTVLLVLLDISFVSRSCHVLSENVLDVLGATANDSDTYRAVPAKPLQFHFHVESEHTLGGETRDNCMH